MLCKKPFRGFGCGQCLPCRIKVRRVWTHRILLEALCHEESCFVTLTYKDMPPGNSLDPRHTQLWLKRFRFALSEHPRYVHQKLRFYLVGEYGEQTHRPHYHAALFGVGNTYEIKTLIQKTWGLGHVKVGTLTLASAQYIAGYVTKKMTKADDERLCGRHPEFGRMSQGIGRDIAPRIAESLGGKDEINTLDDIPYVLFHGRRGLPLGRYLRGKLVPLLGLPDKNGKLSERLKYEKLQTSDHHLRRYHELQDVLSRFADYPPGTPRYEILKKIHADIDAENQQRITKLESRHNLNASHRY